MATLGRGVPLGPHALLLCTFIHEFHLVIWNAVIYLNAVTVIMDNPIPNLPKGSQKARSLEEILLELGPATSVSYDPIQVENKQAASVLLPATFPQEPHPFDYFSLFFTHDLFQTITKNTNRYASLKRQDREEGKEEVLREWKDLNTYELYVFIGAIIYMGIHEEPRIDMYWNTDSNKGPLHSIPSHITLRRFEQIKRYCHISCPNRDQEKGFHLPSNKIWWYKLEPLASSLRASCQQYYSPSSEVSIDELMVQCFGRFVVYTSF